MPGNSQRRGAVRRTSKPTAGSGGRIKRGLEGKGPTPKAADRPNHKAHKMAKAADRRGGATGGRTSTRKDKASSEMVVGRNAVLEAHPGFENLFPGRAAGEDSPLTRVRREGRETEVGAQPLPAGWEWDAGCWAGARTGPASAGRVGWCWTPTVR